MGFFKSVAQITVAGALGGAPAVLATGLYKVAEAAAESFGDDEGADAIRSVEAVTDVCEGISNVCDSDD